MNNAGHDVLTISELVKARLNEGYSLRDLTTASGGAVDDTTFFRLSQNDVKSWPTKPATIEGLARALGVDVRLVVHGYARQLGIDIHENRSLLASMLPAAADSLSVKQAQAVAGLISAFAPASVEADAVTLDLNDFSPENIRSVIALTGELKLRAEQTAEQGNPEMAATFDALASFLEAAMRAASD